ncbi:MAG: sensor histidine kinase [Deltaproteobacteria bacterium]|nr:sensor histidine kinase [Deltaproteobacteria bacterium]
MRLLPDHPEISWTPYAYLIYTAPFVLKPIFAPRMPFELLLSFVGLAAFLSLYFWGWWLEDHRKLIPIAGITLLGLLFAPVNFGASSFFIFASAFAGNLRPTRFAVRTILFLTILVGLTAVWIQPSPMFWGPALVFTPLIGGLCLHQQTVRTANAQLKLSREEVQRLAQVAERERIARDLHDLLGHTLSTITLKASLASRLAVSDPARAAEEMREVERISREATQEVRGAVAGYRTRSLEEELASARTALDAASVTFEVLGSTPRLSPIEEGVLALALREAVTNVVRHAGARRCKVIFALDDEGLRLEVVDDGRGAYGPEGSGLLGMRERLASLGGNLQRITDAGTRLVIRLPYPTVSEAVP